MFRLGSALSVGRKLYSDTIGRLIQKLSIRGTYSENLIDTRNIISDIDNASILDDATILLTPTSYSNARVHSVKKYTGDDYVVGGDFSDFSTDWSTNTATESGGVVTIPDGGYIYQNISFPDDGIVKLKVEGSGTIKYRTGLTLPSSSYVTLSLPFTDYVELDVTDTRIQFNNTSGSDVTVTSVSMIDVSSDFDFDRASSATRINSDGLVQDMQSITDPELVLNGDFEELGDDLVTNGNFSGGSTGWSTIGSGITITDRANFNTDANESLAQEGVLTNGKTYKVVFDILSIDDGNISVYAQTNGYIQTFTTTGTKEVYFTYDGTDGQIRFRGVVGTGFEGSIDNISIQQVDPNDRWTVGDKWSIANGAARLVSNDSDGSGFIQSSIFTIGNTYNITFDATVVSGKAKLESGGGGTLIEIDETKTYNHTFVAERTDLYFNRITSVSDISLDNISVKDITFSTDVDLARINYDSNGENGHILLEPTSTNLITYSEDFTQWSKLNGGTGSLPVVTSNTTISPSGEQNADTISFDKGAASGGGDYSLLRLDYGGADVDGTASIYLKADTNVDIEICLLYTSPSPRDGLLSRMPSSA